MNLEILHKSYDLRWIYPTEINEELYYKIGLAYGKLLDKKTYYIWMDARLSWPKLSQALANWILDSGKNVVDIWICSTDMIYFVTGTYADAEVGIMITASHNPGDYNWIKSCLKNAVPLNMKTFGKEISDFIGKWIFDIEEDAGIYRKKDVSDDFIGHVASFINSNNIKTLKIVADAGNWTAWVFMQKLADKLNFELIPLYFEPDGNFPNHHPSPIEPENVKDLINKVLETKADLWVAFDGDADRMYICDEEGVIWSGTITVAMIADMLLTKNPWKKVLYNAVCGNIVPEIIAQNKGIAIKEKVGHVYIKDTMWKDEEIIFAWEHSGHYYFRENWCADSWVIAFVIVLELICKTNKNASLLRQIYDKYPTIPETNFKVKDVKEKLQELKNTYKDWIQNEFDGLTVRYKDWWFNVRPSSNEPLLRLNMEADNESLLEEKKEELVGIIKG